MRSLIAGLICLLPFAADAAGPYGRVVVGNWSGGAFTNDQTGRFSHCAVSAGYKNGVRMLTSVTSQMSWVLGFSKPEWRLNPGQKLRLQLVFDRSRTLDVTADVKTPSLVTIPMPANSDLVIAFRQGRYLELVANDARFTFALTSTGEMLPQLVECVRQSGNITGPIAQRPPSDPRDATERPGGSAPVDNAALAEKKAVLEKSRDLIRSRMLACIGKEGSTMLLTDEKAEVVAKAAMIFCKPDVDALVNATIEIIETEEGRPSNRNAIRVSAEQRVQEVVTAHVVRSRGEMMNRNRQQPTPGAPPPQKDGARPATSI